MSAELPDLGPCLRFLAALPGVGPQHPLYEIKSVNEMYKQGEISATWADLMVRRILWHGGYARGQDRCVTLHRALLSDIACSGMWVQPYLHGYDRGQNLLQMEVGTHRFNRNGLVRVDPAAVQAFRADILQLGWGDAPRPKSLSMRPPSHSFMPRGTYEFFLARCMASRARASGEGSSNIGLGSSSTEASPS